MGKYITTKVLEVALALSFFIAIGVLVYLHYFYQAADKTLTMLDAIVPTAAAGLVTYVIFHYQSKQEKVRDEILEQTRHLSDKQDRIQHYSVRGPLIGIAYLMFKLSYIINPYFTDPPKSWQDLQNYDQSSISDYSKKIQCESKPICNLIGVIYEEIETCIKYLDIQNYKPDNWKVQLNKAKHMLNMIRDHIDGFLFEPLRPEDFEKVNFSIALKSNKVRIVVGSKRDYDNKETNKKLRKAVQDDFCSSEKLLKYINAGDNPKMDKDQNLNEDYNLILVGGPTVNDLTRLASPKMPLQYVQVHGEDKIYSRITGELYGLDYSVIQAIKSPFSKDKIIVCVFGLDWYGTPRSIQVLIDLLNKRLNEEDLKNESLRWCPGKVIKKVEVPKKVTTAPISFQSTTTAITTMIL